MKGAKKRRSLPGRESAAARRERVASLAGRLGETYPDADCELAWRSPFELLIATILSAQCTDKMVNQVTPALFDEFPDAAALARAPRRRVEHLIRRTGFYSQKTKSIRECAKAIVSEFGGEVPRDLDSLVRLQGVGRKTASVVVGTAFRQPAVFVDTHVNRLTNRLGITRSGEPKEIEADIKGLLPPAEWTAFCHRLIHHGRRVCAVRAPRCEACSLADLCPRIGL